MCINNINGICIRFTNDKDICLVLNKSIISYLLKISIFFKNKYIFIYLFILCKFILCRYIHNIVYYTNYSLLNIFMSRFTDCKWQLKSVSFWNFALFRIFSIMKIAAASTLSSIASGNLPY